MDTLSKQLKSKLLCSTSQKERKVYLDYVRFLATVFVICAHVIGLANASLCPGTLEYRLTEICIFVCMSCNQLFIMVSGALLLPVKGERLREFYVKRFLKVAIPFVVYYIIYVCAGEGMQCLYPSYWLTFIKRIFTGAPIEAPHFWLIYVILFLYVLTPFLRYLVQNIPEGVLGGVILVVFMINALDTYLPLFGIESYLSGIVDTYAGTFLLGYYLSGRAGRRTENILLLGGIVSFFITCYIIFFHGWYQDYIYNNAPTMLLFAAALFLSAKRLAEHWVTKNRLLGLISRYSFSVLLIHWAVLHVAVKNVLHIDVMSGGIVGGCLLAGVLTLVLSLLGGIFFDFVLICPLQRMLTAIAGTRKDKQCV